MDIQANTTCTVQAHLQSSLEVAGTTNQLSGPIRSPGSWRGGTNITIGAGGLGFDSTAGQIEHNVADGSPPLRSFFGAV